MRRCASFGIAALLCVLLVSCAPPRPDHPVIGAKNFTEQVVLGELLAQEIEAKSNLKVERRFYLAGSYICHQALVAGRIDGYVEYTGTALTAILKQRSSFSSSNCAAALRCEIRRRCGRAVGIRKHICDGDSRRRCTALPIVDFEPSGSVYAAVAAWRRL
jgi:osmoprotectant transport system substrate-binding protein